MIKKRVTKLFLTFGLISSFFAFQQKTFADYSFETTSEVWSTETSDSVFELNASEDEVSCSAGGGSTPSMWVGTMTGNGNTDANDYDGTDKSDDFFAGGVGFNIPLGSKKNYDNCDRVLAIVEAEKFIKMVGSLQDLGVYNEEKVKEVVNKYLVSTENKLGIDLTSSF
jgi:hypothetical protein|tara:strand:+ start:76 stop:579 length:504 start_codon:yes stop_codon:yes gene_type:complete